eukprot:gene6038-10039_t
MYFYDEEENYQCRFTDLNISNKNEFSPTKEYFVSVLQIKLPQEKVSGNQSRSIEQNSLYFEITLNNCTIDKMYYPEIGVGFNDTSIFDLNIIQPTFVGWDRHSVGFHFDNGGFYDNSGTGEPKISKYRGYKGITIGVCWDLKNDKIFFTRNGRIMKNENKKIEMKRNYIKHKLYPTITCRNDLNISYSINFGDDVSINPFKFELFNLKTMNLTNDFCDVLIMN